MAEITLNSVLLECLSIMREEQRICSKDYKSLEPAKGMEEAWDQGRKKIQILQDAIPALKSEPVKRAMADWQKDVMENGQGPLEIEKEYRAIKASKDFKELMGEQLALTDDHLDHEDGTLDLR